MKRWTVYYYYPNTIGNLRYIAYIQADNADNACDKAVRLFGFDIIVTGIYESHIKDNSVRYE